MAACFKTAVVHHLRQRHADFVGNDLDCFREGDALDLHYKIENRAAFMTTKAVEDFLGRTDGKRRRLFLMKRAAGHPVRALLLELHVVLDHPDDVCLSFEVVDESLGVTHYLKICIRVRSTTAVRRRYFLKSALLTNASTIFETASAPCLVGRNT